MRIFFRLGFALWISLLSSVLFATNIPNSQTMPQLSKITYEDQQLANKILISLHHAIIESNHKKKYLIANLSTDDKKLLASYEVTITDAQQWTEKLQKLLLQRTDSKQITTDGKTTNKIIADGIPGYECFATVEETYAQAVQLQLKSPLFSDWIDIGDSWQKVNNSNGYDLMVLKITNQAITTEKPILFIHSSMHAREYAPAALTLDFAKWLLNDYDSDPEAKWLVDHREIHLLFHMNPDGRKIAESQVYQRKNTNDNHCAGPDVGVDLNRNFAQTWNSTVNGSSGDECSQVYRGLTAESEPETQAVSNYIRQLFPDDRGPNDGDAAPDDKSGLHLDIHSYGRLILWPYGHTYTNSANNDSFVALGNKLAWFNDYAPQQSIGLYPTDGTSDNVSYGELGVAALTFELGTSFFQDCAIYEARIKPDNLKALVYSAKVSEAPYKMPFGPDIASLTVNQSVNQTTVAQGVEIELEILSVTDQTLLSKPLDIVENIQYSIDIPFSKTDATIISLQAAIVFDNEGNASVSTSIDTKDLAFGQHTIFVRAINSSGQEGANQAIFINIASNNAPIPSFTVSCQELICTFDASASNDSDGSIAIYQWQFSDTNTATGEVANHTFLAAGEKSATLTITDNNQLKATIDQAFSVTQSNVSTIQEPDDGKSGGTVYWLLIICLIVLHRQKNNFISMITSLMSFKVLP